MNTLTGYIKSLFSIKIVCLFLFLGSCYILHAQPVSDTTQASKYFSKAEILLADWKLDSAIVHFKKALPIYEKENAQKRIADSYDKIAEAHRKNYDLEDALKNAKKSLEIRLQEFGAEHTAVATSYNSIGHILKGQDQYQNALDYYQKALAIQLATFEERDYHVANCYHNIGSIHHVLAEYDKALEYYKKGLTIRTNTFGTKHPKIADSYIDLGTTYYHLGEYNKALDYHQKALQIREVIFGKNSAEAAFCYNHIGNILTYLDDFDKALEHLEKALVILDKTFGIEHTNVALCNISISKFFRISGKYDMALSLLNKVLPILIDKFKIYHSTFSYLFIEFANIYFKKGWYDQSITYQQKVLYIDSKIYPKNHSFIGTDYNNIGVMHQYKGQYDIAISYYKKTLINYINSLGKNHNAVARVYNNIANTYKAKKEYDIALTYYQKTLKIRIHTLGERHSLNSYSYLDIGDIYVVKKEYDIALQYYQKALKIQEHLFGEINYYICDIYNAIANVYSEKEEYNKAIKHLQQSITIRLQTDGKHHPRTAKSYNQIANVYYKTEKYDKATLYYNKAIIANTKPNTELIDANKLNPDNYLDANILLHTLQGKAKTLQKRFVDNNKNNDLNTSINIYQKTDVLIHYIRQTLQNHNDKITFAQQAKEVYTDAIQAQLLSYKKYQKQQSLERAFYYSEKSKANTLKELLLDSNAKSFSGLPKSILELEQHLKAERSIYTSEILQERTSQFTDTFKINTYESKLFDLDRKQDSLTQIIEKNYPKYYQLKHQDTIISVSNIQEKLSPNTTVLEFFSSDRISYAFLISKNNINVTVLSTPELTKPIEQLKKTIINKNIIPFKEISHQLYTTLIQPIKDHITGDELIIIPDGSLWHLNFELLLTQKDASKDPRVLSYLLKEYAISYASSTTLLFNSFKNKKIPKKQQECLAFSFSNTEVTDSKTMSLATLRNTGDDLPGTRKEIKAISDIVDGEYYYGQQAIEANFKKKASQYNILHLALHGEIDNKHPENSKLLFTKSKDSIEDNYLYSHELFAMDIPAELTVLSACNTGSGKISKGEGIMSLGNAFQYAGTKSLLLSSWEVSDQTTPELIKYFYINLKKGMNKAKALQQAKLQYLNTANINRLDPFYWGSFYLVGDATPMYFKNNTMIYWNIGLGILGVLLILGFWYRRKKD
ncbi:CHAT domain-containing protein [Aquimarina algiphila]|uniref:CHAT domain-containing protein n=1 Tax=Aquimarina algiphila TaxID=2047982 RepID=UPI002331000F|nr:CHAT domain-containing tetratricopeptide repeat protein [Aquimarina algiphila]